MPIELISFKLCPFVQRAAIVLQEKHVPYHTTYIDLKAPPAWFSQISPLGKVPVLRMDDSVLFESAVIAEYLDETHPPALMPQDPLQKAKNRAWIEFASALTGEIYQMLVAKDSKRMSAQIAVIDGLFKHLEQSLNGGPYFNGERFSLVDAAFAPAFKHLSLFDAKKPLVTLYNDYPKLTDWKNNLLCRPSVNQSVVADFAALYQDYLREANSHLLQLT